MAGRVDPATKLWAECYPLPIGEEAVRRLYAGSGQRYPGERLAGLLPFRGSEEAYWGVRVRGNCSVLDMFGLKGRTPPDSGSEEYLWFGNLAYSLSGAGDTSLMDLAKNGVAWWGGFSAGKVRGRPRGSGTYGKRPELFETDVRKAVAAVRSRGEKPTQARVAGEMCTSDRQLRAWIKDFEEYGITWEKIAY